MSVTRACDFYLATDKKWYVMLGMDEGCEEWDDCFAIGPFDSLHDAESSIASAPYPNTGGSEIDESATETPPQDRGYILNDKSTLLRGDLRI
tara:strand:+ start:3009 stop:3284 length:276 start_codon:yes stop_codon:yes gene_type:complete